MTDTIRKDLATGDTQRNKLTDLAADHAASVWLELGYPKPYRSVRYCKGRLVEVIIRESEERRKNPGDGDE